MILNSFNKSYASFLNHTCPVRVKYENSVSFDNDNFNISYRIFNGTMDTLQIWDNEFTINTHSKTSGIFEIMIPRNFPYYTGKDGPGISEKWLVIENGVQLTPNEYVKTISDCFFTYSVPVYGNSTISFASEDSILLVTPIYGDKVPGHCIYETRIPEFPTASVVLLASIVSVITFYRIRFRK